MDIFGVCFTWNKLDAAMSYQTVLPVALTAGIKKESKALLCESVGVAVSEVMYSIKEPLSTQRHDVTSPAINKGEIAHQAPDELRYRGGEKGSRTFFV